MKNDIKGDYVVFTDGSSRGNPGPGGWGAVIVESEKEGGPGSNSGGIPNIMELGGGEKKTTNNRMELKAAAKALEHIPRGSYVTVYTDSSYLINGVTKWLSGWKRNGWQTKSKQDVLNKDIWMEIDNAAGAHKITWRYVGGHAGVKGNERCDVIATGFADAENPKLYHGSLSGYDILDIANVSHDEQKMAEKKASSSRSRAQAYSYVSSVKGEIKLHKTWAECEKRVKGERSARFRKSLDREDEINIINEFRK